MAEEKEIGSLGVKIGLDGTGFQAGVGAINKQLAVVRSELTLATAKIVGFGSESDRQKVKADGLTKIIELQEQKIKVLTTAFDKSVEAKGRDASATLDLEIKMNKAKTALANMENELKATTKQLDTQSPKVKELGNDFESTSKKIKSAGQDIKNVGQSLTIGVTAPIVGVGYAAGKASIDFETAFAGVKKTINATTEEFAGLRQGIRDMAQDIPVTVEEISHVEEAAGQLGISKSHIEDFSKVMVEMGVATNLASDTAATELAKIANITQMPQTEFDRLGSTIVRLGNNMATTEADIVAMDLRLAGAGHTIGLTNAQTLGFSAALSSVGIEAEAGGSAFSKLMVDMASATASGGKQLNNLAIVSGMTSAQFKKSFKEDAAGTITTFIDGLGKMQKSGQNVFGVLDTLGMSEVRMRDALLRAAGAGDLFGKALDNANKGWVENNALQKEAEQRFATSASQLQIMKNKLNDVGITLGDVLVPALLTAMNDAEPLFNLVKDGANWFAGLPKPIQTTVIAIAGITAVAGPATVALGFLTVGVGSLGTALALVTGPIGLVAAGVAVLGASGAVLIANWDKIGVAGRSLVKAILDSLGPIGMMASSVVKLGAAGIELARNWDEVKVKMAAIFEGIAYHVKTAMNDVIIFVSDAIYKVINSFSKLTEFIPGLNSKVESSRVAIARMIDTVKTNQDNGKLQHDLNQSAYALDLVTIAADKAKKANKDLLSSFKLPPAMVDLINFGGKKTFQDFLKEGEAPPTQTATGGVVSSGSTDPLTLEGGTGAGKTPEQLRKEAYDADLEMAKFNAQFYNQTTTQQIAALNKVAAAHKQHLKEDIGDEHAYLLEVKKLREDGVKQSETANKDKFEDSKRQIASKKELNQLSEKDELAAWKRVSAQYKAGTDEKIEADKNYYKLKADMDKTAKDNAVKAADDMDKEIIKALKDKYDQERTIAVRANEQSVQDEENASHKRIEIYDDEHAAKIKLLDDASYSQTKAIQDQIQALDDQVRDQENIVKNHEFEVKKAELEAKLNAVSNAKEIADAKQKLLSATSEQQFRAVDAQAEYEDAIANANSPEERVKAQQVLNNRLLGLGQDVATAQSQLNTQTALNAANKAGAQAELDSLVSNHNIDLQKQANDKLKESLQDQIEAIRKKTEDAKALEDDQYSHQKRNEEDGLTSFKQNLDKEKTALNDHYDALTKDDALAAEARRLALDTNNAELITLLGTYNPQWQNAGQSFGESLLTGLNSTKANIQTAIAGILAGVGKAKTAQAGLNVAQGLAGGITLGLTNVKGAGVALAGAAVGAIVGTLKIKSPSEVTTKLGQFTGQGFANGMGNMISKIKEQARQFSTAALPGSTRFGGSSDVSSSSASGKGSVTQILQFAAGAIQINASDIKSMQDLISLFERLPQANRAR